MHIVLAVHHFPPHYTGGAEWRAYRTAAALQERGHSVQVISVEHIDQGPSEGVSWVDEAYQGVPVRRLSFNKAVVPDPFEWEYDNHWIGAHLEQFLSEQRPDLFHLIGGYLISGRALRVAQQLQIPNAVTLTDFWFLCPRTSMLRSNGEVSTLPIDPQICARCLGEESRRFRLPAQLFPGLMNRYWQSQTQQAQAITERIEFLREALNTADAIIAPSRFMLDMFQQAGINPQRLVFSRQGRDFPDLDPAGLKKNPAEHLRTGYLGQIAPIKGVHLLFEAVHRLPELNLTVTAYGDSSKFPDYTAHLERLAAQDRRLSLAGVYSSEALSDVLRGLDVIVVPSTWYENSPNVILEAFAHQTPVIAANLGGMAELVQHEVNGLLFEPDNSISLASQLRRLVVEPDLLGRLQAGIGPVKSTAEEMDELLAIYHSLVVQSRSKSVEVV